MSFKQAVPCAPGEISMAQRRVAAAGIEQRTRRVEYTPADPVRVPRENALHEFGRGVPNSDGAIVTGRCEKDAVRQERARVHSKGVTL